MRYSPYLYVAPFFVLFAIFGLFPVIYTLWISLHDWTLLGGQEAFVGLDNYAYLLFEDTRFYNALFNTLGMFVLATVPQLLIALLLADLLNRRIRFRGFFRVSVIFPYVTSVAATALVFGQLFGRDYGLINYVIELVGLPPVNWQSGRLASWSAVSIMVDWRWIGYNTLIYLAAMQAIPKDLYEAAAIDGASRMRQFWQITIPMLQPTILFTVIISTIGGMQLFTEPVMFGGGDYDGGSQAEFQTIAMYMFSEAFGRQDYGYGSAVAWIIFVVIILFSLINVLFVQRIRSAV
ncbi:carbohydrate ABC transporter permease [Allonocardiopsis opalescens]|nr:sugar ABC transporter permease [Allonocardiopsis opalescens]